MFAWLYNKFNLSKKQSPPKTPLKTPKIVTIFDSVSYLSPDGEKTSPIDLETKSKQRKQNQNNGNKIQSIGIKIQKLIIKNHLYELQTDYIMMLLRILGYIHPNHYPELYQQKRGLIQLLEQNLY
jgi:hypothetical protein